MSLNIYIKFLQNFSLCVINYLHNNHLTKWNNIYETRLKHIKSWSDQNIGEGLMTVAIQDTRQHFVLGP